MRRLILLVVITAVATVGFLYASGRFRFLVLQRGVTVELNGRPIRADVLQYRLDAILTVRDGESHSYFLNYSGDGDATVTDCKGWVAPRSILLIETQDYPPCQDRRGRQRRSLRWMGGGEGFVTDKGETITIRRRPAAP